MYMYIRSIFVALKVFYNFNNALRESCPVLFIGHIYLFDSGHDNQFSIYFTLKKCST